MQINISDFTDPKLISKLNKFLAYLRRKTKPEDRTPITQAQEAGSAPTDDDVEMAWAIIIVKAWRAAVRHFSVQHCRPGTWPVCNFFLFILDLNLV